MGRRGRGVLVDAGLPARLIEGRMAAAGLDPTGVEALVVTHEHRDHLSGVGAWARSYRVPVYMTAGCREAISGGIARDQLDGAEVVEFEPGRAFEAGGFEFYPVPTSHDAADSVGFRIADGTSVLGFATDLGVASPALIQGLQGAALLYLESNHDESLLLSGPYPWFLKQRIRSCRGHLSNEACGALVSELFHDGLKAVVLGHLSEVNNRRQLAYAATRQALRKWKAEGSVMVLVARQDGPGRVLSV